MYLNIENTFMFNFFPNISNKEISIESANNIIQFLIKYKAYYSKKYLTFYNTKTFICAINYEDNKWLILDQKYNILEINFKTTNFFVINNSNEYISKNISNEFIENNELSKIIINELNELINIK
jgi:hypothetical protein